MEQQQVALAAVALGDVDALQEIVEVAPQIGAGFAPLTPCTRVWTTAAVIASWRSFAVG